MTWIQRILDRITAPSSAAGAPGAVLEEARDKTHRTIMRTLAYGMEAREAELEIVEHSALVSVLCGALGRLLDLSEGDLYILETAAQLHEIGMFTVPPALLLRTAPLSD